MCVDILGFVIFIILNDAYYYVIAKQNIKTNINTTILPKSA